MRGGHVAVVEVRGEREVRGHVTHIVDVSAAIQAVAHVASQAGAVPPALTQVLAVGIPAAAAVVLHTHKIKPMLQDRNQHTCDHFAATICINSII